MVKKFTGILEKTEQLTPTVKGLHFKLANGDNLTFKTGQWLMLEIPNGSKIIKRAMSIASPSFQKKGFDLCVKLIPGGQGSLILHKMKKGETIEVSGPFGKFTLNYPTKADLIMIATGSGIAPIRAMLLDLLEHKKAKNEIYLLFGNRTEEEIIYKDLFEGLAEDYKNFHFLPTLSKPVAGWEGEIGWVQDLIRKYISSDKNKEFYLCGVKEMVLDVLKVLDKIGFSKKNIHYERYT